MAFLFIVESPRGTTEGYDKVNERLKNEPRPKGSIFHCVAERDTGGLIFAEVWESEEAREKWITKVDEVVEEFGGFEELPRIKKYKVHNFELAALART